MGRRSARNRVSPKLVNRRKREEARLKKAEEAVRREGLRGEKVKAASKSLATQKDTRSPIETAVASAFGEIISQIREEIKEKRDNGAIVRPAHNAAVDIKLVFNSLDLKSKGLFFKKEQKESSISLELATRVLPEDE